MVDPWCCPKAVFDDTTGWRCPDHGDLMQDAIDAAESQVGGVLAGAALATAAEPAVPDLAGDPRDWTPDQFRKATAWAIRTRKFRLVAALLKLFAATHPGEAEAVYDAMLAFLDEQ